jgi:hypothetical protein
MPDDHRFARKFIDALDAEDRRLLSEMVTLSWLDTIAPENRRAALAEWVQRVAFKIDDRSI